MSWVTLLGEERRRALHLEGVILMYLDPEIPFGTLYDLLLARIPTCVQYREDVCQFLTNEIYFQEVMCHE